MARASLNDRAQFDRNSSMTVCTAMVLVMRLSMFLPVEARQREVSGRCARHGHQSIKPNCQPKYCFRIQNKAIAYAARITSSRDAQRGRVDVVLEALNHEVFAVHRAIRFERKIEDAVAETVRHHAAHDLRL